VVLCYARALEALVEYRQVFRHAESRPVALWLQRSAARELPSTDDDLVGDVLAYHLRDPIDGRAIERRIREQRAKTQSALYSRQYRARRHCALSAN
jgi:hypothetical protein